MKKSARTVKKTKLKGLKKKKNPSDRYYWMSTQVNF